MITTIELHYLMAKNNPFSLPMVEDLLYSFMLDFAVEETNKITK
jgi:hypothetical protein